MGRLEITQNSSNDLYKRYERLIFERDSVSRDANSYQTLYIKEFGSMKKELFEKQVDCIRKKKCIAFCQSAVNRGEKIDLDKMQNHIEECMASYQAKLDELIGQLNDATNSTVISPSDSQKIKTIYRRMAKLIHPDINPTAWQNPEIAELWLRTSQAYNCNDLELLSQLEVLVHKALEESGIEVDEISVDSLETRIKELEKEIATIMHNIPYTLFEILNNDNAIEQEKQELIESIEEYEIYAKELDNELKKYLSKGMTVKWEET